MSKAPLLEFKHVSKRFGGTLAVDNVSLDIYESSIMALLGENGAGKSTLIKLLAGIHQLDTGEICYNGQLIDRSKAPVAFIHQDLGLFEWMTVAENIGMTTGFPKRLGMIDWKATTRLAEKALTLVGGGIDPKTRVFNLSRTEKSLVAIARALVVDAELLILDEPTASLPEGDVARLFDVLKGLRERGLGMIYISHRMDEVFRLTDRVAVMRDGKLIGVRQVSETTEDELVQMIVGRETSEVYSQLPKTDAKTVLKLKDFKIGDVGPLSFELKAGEMVGLVGLRGAGQESVGETLFGLQKLEQGSMTLNNTVLSHSSPKEAMQAGVGFVSRNRQEESLAMSMAVRENFFMNPHMHKRGLWQAKSHKAERTDAMKLIQRFNVQPPEPEYEAFALSGGNQQKVVVGRWLEANFPLLILEEPTQGVDVGAKAEIYSLLHDALDQGVAILVISTDFEEIANICSRALVFNRGKITQELSGNDLNMTSLIHHASGTASYSHIDQAHIDQAHIDQETLKQETRL